MGDHTTITLGNDPTRTLKMQAMQPLDSTSARVQDKEHTGPAPEVDATPINLLEALLSEAKQEAETFTFTVGKGGHKLTARHITDADSLNKIFRRAAKLSKRNASNVPPAWRPYLPISEEVAQGMAFMEVMLIDPKWGHLDMLRLARDAGGYFLSIMAELKAQALGNLVGQAVEEIDDEGND